MNKIKTTGKQEFMGLNIPIIEGGFGDGKRCIAFKTISEIHNIEVKKINQAINRLMEKNRFKQNIDYIDLFTTEELKVTASDLGLITSNGQKTCYILSERGYTKLIKYMDDDKSWDVMEEFIDSYFTMRQAINTMLSAEDMAIISIAKSTNDIERAEAIARYKSIVTTPLLEVIEEQKPMVDLACCRIDKKGCYSLTDVTKSLELKKGRITNWAKSKGYLHKTLTETNKLGEQYFKIYSSDGVHNQFGIKEEGLQLINDNLDEIKNFVKEK